MPVLYLDCCSGISGDMLVGALLDLGWSEDSLRAGLDRLGLNSEFHVHISRQSRCGIAGVKFDVHVPAGDAGHAHHSHAHPHAHSHTDHVHGRTFREIRELLEASTLPEEVRTRAVAVFHRIAVAEGKIHGLPPDDVGFHEVGAIDSIVDIVAACLGMHELGIQQVHTSELFEGSGEIRCAHGNYPLPAPATLEILQGIPLRQIADPMEFITPTGAALLAEFSRSFGPMPPMRISRVGYGAGTRDPANRPNILRAVAGTLSDSDRTPGRIVELQTNLDDLTPELVGDLTVRLLEAGALDVFTLPAAMKNNRPGILLVVLAAEHQANELGRMILCESTAFGVRMHVCERIVLDRRMIEVHTIYGTIPVKEGSLDGKVIQRTPEFSACQQAARAAGVPAREVYAAAMAVAANIGNVGGDK